MKDFNIVHLVDNYSEYEFYGVWENHFKLGNLIFEAVEDENDGYRSYLDSVVMMPEADSTIRKRFPKKPIALVKVVVDEEEFIDIVDTTHNHVWLSIYTDNTCNYYPYFCFTYRPLDLTRFKDYDTDEEGRSPEIINAERFI